MHYLIYDLRHPQETELLPINSLDATESAAYAQRGERYLLTRSLLKRELSRLSGIPAEDIRFTYTEHGKPEFAAQAFNLSHSADLLCLAFHHRAIGVDIQLMREPKRMHLIARRIMCTEQWQAWQDRGCPTAEFFACWCAAEALVKLHGGTIWQASSFPFLYSHGRIIPRYDNAPQVETFIPAAGYCGAISYLP